MTPEKILTTVKSISEMMCVHPNQHKPLQTFFLHKSTALSFEEIAVITGSSKTKVYGSIDRVDKSKNLSQTKAMIFAALK